VAVNFGAGAINNTLDTNLKRPSANAFNLGVSQEVAKGVSLSVEWFRTEQKGIQATRNNTYVVNGLADLSQNSNYVPFTVYSPIDGHAVQMYDFATKTISTAASSNFTYTNESLSTVYNGVDVGFNARLPRGGRLFGGTTTERTLNNTCSNAVDNPNTLLYCDTGNLPQGYSIPWKTQVKLAGTYPLPWYWLVANGSYQGLPGYTLGRTTYTVTATTKYATCPGNSAAAGCVVGGTVYSSLINSSVSVPLDPAGVTLTPRTNQFDFGVSKRIKIGRLRFDPRIDIFNAFNSHAYYSVVSTTFAPIVGPDGTSAPAIPAPATGSKYTSYRQPARFLQGRIFKIGFNASW